MIISYNQSFSQQLAALFCLSILHHCQDMDDLDTMLINGS